MATREQILAGIKVLQAILDTIKEMGSDGAPLGPMYAALMASGMSYESFIQSIELLKKAGRITVSNHCAYYVEAHYG